MALSSPGDSELDLVRRAADQIRSQTDFVPRAHLVLGSGFGAVANRLDSVWSRPMGELNSIPAPSVSGHAGTLALGTIGEVPCLVQRGRVHLYEGFSAREVVRTIRLSRLLGAETLLITNAAGGIRDDLSVGDLMILEDHVNLTGQNPLVGDNLEEWGPRFPDMTTAYDPTLRNTLGEAVTTAGLSPKTGVYGCFLGPTYETPAEIRMARAVGIDAVGMSTVCEVIAAVHGGMKVAGLSCITNRAAGLSGEALSHDEVLEVTRDIEKRVEHALADFLHRLKEQP